MLQISGSRSSGNSITICFIRMSPLLPFLQFPEALLTDVMLNPAGFLFRSDTTSAFPNMETIRHSICILMAICPRYRGWTFLTVHGVSYFFQNILCFMVAPSVGHRSRQGIIGAWGHKGRKPWCTHVWEKGWCTTAFLFHPSVSDNILCIFTSQQGSKRQGYKWILFSRKKEHY